MSIRKSNKHIIAFFNYALLIGIGIVMVFPFYWLLRSSLMDRLEIFTMPIKWIPQKLMLANYTEAFTGIPFLVYFKNTALLVIVNVVATIISSSFVAFGFAKINFPTKNFWFTVVVATIMLPATVMIIPQFIGWKLAGAYDTFWPLMLPAFFGSSFYVFLLRQFFSTIPKEYDEAALVDGANYFTIYYKLILPMSGPALTTVGVFTFMNTWNDYVAPVLYLSSESKYTISLGLRTFLGLYTSQWELLMAAATIAMLPMLIVFFFAQKAFIGGANLTGVKG